MAWSQMDPGLQSAGMALLQVATEWGLGPQVTSTTRSYWKQLELWTNYKLGRSRLPAAPPRRSAHEYGWAFDLVVADRNALQDLGAVWEGWGGTWGRAADPVHFELPNASQTLRDATIEQLADYWYPTLGPMAISRMREDLAAAERAVSLVGPWYAGLIPLPGP